MPSGCTLRTNAVLWLCSSPTQRAGSQLKKLSIKTWAIQYVNVNGTDQTTLFNTMTLSIARNSFTATHGKTVWPSTGTWGFADPQGNTFVRSEGVTVTIDELTPVSTNVFNAG